MTGKPPLGRLWEQAGGGTASYDPQRYHDLLVEHGHLLSPGDEGYDQASRTLSCGWEPGKTRAEQDRCEVTDLLRASCSHCNGRQGGEAATGRDVSELGRVIIARYPGKCSWCGDQFSEGDRIRYDYAGGYVSERCWS